MLLLQGTINLTNMGIAQIDTIVAYNLPTLNADSFVINNITAEEVTFSWSDTTSFGSGINRPDSSILFAIRVTLSGAVGTNTPVVFGSMPKVLEAWAFIGGFSASIPINSVSGSAAVISGTELIAGRISNQIGAGLNMTTIDLTGDVTTSTVTGPLGLYNFFNLPSVGNYTLTPSKNLGYVNGVTTLDIVFLRRHILNVQPLNTPYKIIAGDVDGDSLTSTLDIVHMRRLILGTVPNFPSGMPSWRFVD